MGISPKRISIKSLLTQIAAPKLAEHGFVFQGKLDAVLWRFSRQGNNVEHYITFQKSNLGDSIRFDISTSLKQNTTVYANQLIKRPDDWWAYTDGQTLANVIEELTQIAIAFGIPMFDVLSIPDLRAPEEIGKKLLDDPEGKARNFAGKFGLNLSDETTIAELEQLLLKRKAEIQPTEDWEFMLEASAYLGELTRFHMGGQWIWEDWLNTPSVDGLNGKVNLTFSPLRSVALYWGNPRRESYSLVTQYQISKFFAERA